MIYTPADVRIFPTYLTIGTHSIRLSAIEAIVVKLATTLDSADLFLYLSSERKFIFTFRALGSIVNDINMAVFS